MEAGGQHFELLFSKKLVSRIEDKFLDPFFFIWVLAIVTRHCRSLIYNIEYSDRYTENDFWYPSVVQGSTKCTTRSLEFLWGTLKTKIYKTKPWFESVDYW